MVPQAGITGGWLQRCLFQEQCKRATISDNRLILVGTCLEGFLEAQAPSPEPSWVRAQPPLGNSLLKNSIESRLYGSLLACTHCVNSIRFAPSQMRWCSQRAISRQMAIQRRATSECSSYRGSQWSVHPIDAIQRLLLGYATARRN